MQVTWLWSFYTSDIIRVWILLKFLSQRDTEHTVFLILPHTRTIKGYMAPQA